MKFEIEYIKLGKRYKKIVQASSEDSIIFDKSSTIISIKKKESLFNLQIPVSRSELAFAFSRLSMLIQAGVSLPIALADIAESTKNTTISNIFKSVLMDLNRGISLYDSFLKFDTQIGQISLSFIKLGQNSGRLAMSLQQLCDILQARANIIKKLKKAISYPIIIFISIILAFIFLNIFVVPQFIDIFSQLKHSLPIPTRILIGSYEILKNNYILILFIIFFLPILVWIFYFHSNRFCLFVDSILLRIFPFSNMILFSNISIFCLVFSNLLSSGIPIIDALNQAKDSMSNKKLKNDLLHLGSFISNNAMSLKTAFSQFNFFDSTALCLIDTAEQTGTLPQMFSKIDKYYFDKFENMILNINLYIEPILLAFVGILVLILALGIFMPVWDMSSIGAF